MTPSAEILEQLFGQLSRQGRFRNTTFRNAQGTNTGTSERNSKQTAAGAKSIEKIEKGRVKRPIHIQQKNMLAETKGEK